MQLSKRRFVFHRVFSSRKLRPLTEKIFVPPLDRHNQVLLLLFGSRHFSPKGRSSDGESREESRKAVGEKEDVLLNARLPGKRDVSVSENIIVSVLTTTIIQEKKCTISCMRRPALPGGVKPRLQDSD